MALNAPTPKTSKKKALKESVYLCEDESEEEDEEETQDPDFKIEEHENDEVN